MRTRTNAYRQSSERLSIWSSADPTAARSELLFFVWKSSSANLGLGCGLGASRSENVIEVKKKPACPSKSSRRWSPLRLP
jgi:hypothetical protein